MQANHISEHEAYKDKAAAFVKALKHQPTSKDEELANAIMTKDLNCQHKGTDCASDWA
jgi:hypothetical protein